MKYIKYIGLVLTIAAMIYTKNKIDARNKSNTKILDSLDQEEEGVSASAQKSKK